MNESFDNEFQSGIILVILASHVNQCVLETAKSWSRSHAGFQ